MLPNADTGLPMQHRPSPRHYGKADAFLASDDAEMVTGFDLRVDAGAPSPATGCGARARRSSITASNLGELPPS
ncbi:MAG: hypothetical protein J4N93_00155 [Chloroflexi bacterium]|nr:hypothetical protein [Chloroflexota bacterium]